ncbi:uncharacterized protein LOC142518572 isoform X2 [Primulina tabacum]|uniref:uncharacterized protein LOC142518572 isoform X2 n=1 Tax=Primulina tabacum TaxID=48773 RepID=UPI003F5ADA83
MSDNNMIFFKDFQRKRCSESGKRKLLEGGFDQSFDVSSASKRARVSPEFVNLQNGDFAGCKESSLFGLKLEISDSFLDLMNKKLCEGKQVHFSYHQIHGLYLNNRRKTRFDASGSSQQKIKASNLAVDLLKIGSWQKHSSNRGDLTAKFYYAKRRMVWEILEGILKSKIEIKWSDIMAIRAVVGETDQPGILEIQLNKPPSFSRETNPQPRRLTSWAPVSDFTGGQATITRRHLVVFPPGLLDKHYEQLLKCDERLSALNQLPFPDPECPFFYTNPPQHSLCLNGSRLGFESTFIRPSPNSTVPGNNGQVPCSNEGTLEAEVEAMIRSYHNPTSMQLYNNNNLIETFMACDVTDNNLE